MSKQVPTAGGTATKPLDLRDFMKGGEPAKTEASPSSIPSKTVASMLDKQATKAQTPILQPSKHAAGPQTKWYFFCPRNGFGFIHEATKKRYAARGNYLEVDNKEIADFIKVSYALYAQEITDEMYTLGHTLKE